MTEFQETINKVQSDYQRKISESIAYFANKNNISLYDLVKFGKHHIYSDNIIGENRIEFHYKDKKIFIATCKPVTNLPDSYYFVIDVIPVDNYLI